MQVSLEGEQIKLRASRSLLTPELLARIQAHKSELILALRRHSKIAPLQPEPDVLTDTEVDTVCRLMNGMGRDAFIWVLGDGGQADRYERERGFSHRDADLTAAVDYLLHVYQPSGEQHDNRVKHIEEMGRRHETYPEMTKKPIASQESAEASTSDEAAVPAPAGNDLDWTGGEA